MNIHKILSTAITRILIITLSSYVITTLMSPHHNKKFTVRIPRLARYITGFGSCFYPYLLFMFFYQSSASFIPLLIFVVLWIITFFVFIASLNWKIIYSEKGFLFRSIFHRTIFFTYSQIDRIIFTKSEYILSIQKRKIRVPMFAENSDDFLSYLKKYRR